MSRIDADEWAAQIYRKAKQLSILFVQLGASNEPARRALLCQDVLTLDLQSYLEGSSEPGKVLILDGIETLTGDRARSQFGPLRKRVFEDVDLGCAIILLSRSPRIAFPDVVGSSLLDDASFCHGPASVVAAPAGWSSCVEDGLNAEETLTRVIFELGPELCSSLDRALFEDALVGTEALSLLSARELEALDGANITCRVDSARVWNFPRHLSGLKAMLADVLAQTVEPQQQLASVSGGLWKIERLIRARIRTKAVEIWGSSWKQSCLNGDLPKKALERASESAYLGATSLKQVRDPLEWLTLGELLQVKDRSEMDKLGVPPVVWVQFGLQVMPIRNRLAHMRTLRPEDSANVVKWLNIIETRLGAQ